jgi:hypothetical protein
VSLTNSPVSARRHVISLVVLRFPLGYRILQLYGVRCCATPPARHLSTRPLHLRPAFFNCSPSSFSDISHYENPVISIMLLTVFSSAYIILPLAPLVLASTSSPCYYPDGTYQSNDSPCFPDQAESSCCGQGHSCMSNGLCRWPDADMPAPLVYVRGSCTDKSCKLSA